MTGICVITATAGELVTMYRFDAAEALDLIEREKVTVVAGVPAVVQVAARAPECGRT